MKWSQFETPDVKAEGAGFSTLCIERATHQLMILGLTPTTSMALNYSKNFKLKLLRLDDLMHKSPRITTATDITSHDPSNHEEMSSPTSPTLAGMPTLDYPECIPPPNLWTATTHLNLNYHTARM